MKDWLVFRMGVATIRILIWNVTCMLHAEYRILLYVYCLILIGIQTPAISLFLLTSHASLNSRLHVLWGESALNESPLIQQDPPYFLVLWCAMAESGL